MTDAKRKQKQRERYKALNLKRLEVYIYADDKKAEAAVKALDKREEARMGEQAREVYFEG